MHRFFVSEGKNLQLTSEDSHHALRVLRMRAGHRLVAVLPGGPEFLCEIGAVQEGIVQLKVLEERSPSSEPPVDVILYQGLPKGDKMDFIVEKVSEIGVRRVVPVLCKRSVSRPQGPSAAKKVKRWSRIAREAAAVSGRLYVPEILPIAGWDEALGSLVAPLSLIAWEDGPERGIGQVLEGSTDREIALFIGPEGGFEEEEVNEAGERGVLPVSLGPRILRTETAAITAVALVLAILGDLGRGGGASKGLEHRRN